MVELSMEHVVNAAALIGQVRFQGSTPPRTRPIDTRINRLLTGSYATQNHEKATACRHPYAWRS